MLLFILALLPPLCSTLSLEEKAGQVLMVHCKSGDEQTLIQDVKVGGVIYYNWANDLSSLQTVKHLSEHLQSLSSIPLLIAVDQEGGRVARLQNGFTKIPSNEALAKQQNPSLAEEAAFTIGNELRAAGVNMNLAPVVDIQSNPDNRVIGDRSFGSSPETVIEFGRKALNGYRRSRIIATLKHYPGHGDTSLDSHEHLPVIHKSLAALAKQELLPFQALSPHVDAIMTAHILVPALDHKFCCTLSKKALSYLRGTIGFKGVIVADSLIMEGVLKQTKTVDKAAILALQAGCDLLILGGKLLTGEKKNVELTASDIQRIHQSIIAAVKSGQITQSRLNDAVERILVLKTKSADITRQIGEKIWHNECNQTMDGLTFWKQGENFPSFGIGHFIWYPDDKQDHFQESFPALLAFLQKHHTSIPTWLKTCKGCPWTTRSAFQQDQHSPKMTELRQFLLDTKDLQATFIIQRFQADFQAILATSTKPNQIAQHYERLIQDPNGLYALIDYLNFKGSGTSPNERYQNQGWGLLQVLEHMSASSIHDFVETARQLLIQRVDNSPPARNEQQWLAGWLNRLSTYISQTP